MTRPFADTATLATRRPAPLRLAAARTVVCRLTAGLWAVPAGSAHGSEHARGILWGQTAMRIGHSSGLLLPVMLVWRLWPTLWRSRATGSAPDKTP